MIPNGDTLHIKSYRSVILFYCSNCYAESGRKFCVMSVTNYQIHIFVIDSQCNDGYPRSCERFSAKYEKMTHSFTFYYVTLIKDILNCNFRPWQCMWELYWSLNIYGWYQAISSKSNCQVWVLPSVFPSIPYLCRYVWYQQIYTKRIGS